MNNYYVKIDDEYLQFDDRSQLFLSSDKVGTPFQVTNEDMARKLLELYYPDTVCNGLTLEEVTPNCYIQMYVTPDILVWCDDCAWHNIRDVELLGVHPISYSNVDNAIAQRNLLTSSQPGKPYLAAVI